jgi:hypothetical protein
MVTNFYENTGLIEFLLKMTSREFHEPHFRLWHAAVAGAAPRLCRVRRHARLPRGRGAAVPRRSRGRAAARPLSAAAARRGGIQQPRMRGQPARSAATGGPAWGAEQRRWVGGAEGGPADSLGAPRTTEGLVGQGRAPGVGSERRAADATAVLRHTRPRGSQAAHLGARGGKMRVIIRRIQRAYFRRNRSAGSRATSFAVRHRRRVHAHMHFSVVFHTKTLPEQGRSCG